MDITILMTARPFGVDASVYVCDKVNELMCAAVCWGTGGAVMEPFRCSFWCQVEKSRLITSQAKVSVN